GKSRPPAPQEPFTDAPREQHTHQRRVEQRPNYRGFHQPVVVNDSAASADVNGAVQDAPAAAAETANPAGCGGDRKRNEQREREKAHGDEGALVNIFPDFVHVEEFVKHKVSCEMEAGVEKREEAEHAAETNQLGKVNELAQRGNGEGEHEKAKGPVAGGMLDELEWVGDGVATKE